MASVEALPSTFNALATPALMSCGRRFQCLKRQRSPYLIEYQRLTDCARRHDAARRGDGRRIACDRYCINFDPIVAKSSCEGAKR
jgi:hypothetical protein